MAGYGKPETRIRGVVVPRRRFTRWALLYFLLFVCLPLLALALAIDSAFYFLLLD